MAYYFMNVANILLNFNNCARSTTPLATRGMDDYLRGGHAPIFRNRIKCARGYAARHQGGGRLSLWARLTFAETEIYEKNVITT